MKPIYNFKSVLLLTILTIVAGFSQLLQAQPYQVPLASATYSENFDELYTGGTSFNFTLPNGWVLAQGVTLPVYNAALSCQSPPFRYLTNTVPLNCNTLTRNYDGGLTGGTGNSATATGGGRIIFGDSNTGADRSIGFSSLNSTTSSDYRSPTNYVMFGFVNQTGSNIVSLSVANSVKQYRLNTTASTVTFYYSYDGSNWTHLSSGDLGPFPAGASSYLWSSPSVSNANFNITGLSITNGASFFLSWQFVIANSSGSFCEFLGLDDVSLVATYGAVSVAGSSTWTAGSGGWATAGNWLGSTLPASLNNIVYAGAGGNSTNNLAAVSTGTGTLGSLTFSNTAGAYTLTGNGISLSKGVTNNSTANETLNLPLTLLTDDTFSPNTGNLTINSIISNNTYTLIFAGASNTTFNGYSTGTGDLTMAGNGVLLLNGANVYGGSTAINSGTLRLGSSSALPNTTPLNVGTGIFDLNNFNATVTSLAGNGNVTLGTGTLTLSNTIAATFSGVISGTGGVVKAGTATETISGTNTLTGPFTIQSGTLSLGSTAYLGSGPMVLSGGTFQTSGTRDVTNGVISNSFVLSSDSIVQNTTSATAGTRNLPWGGAAIATNGTLTLQNIATGNFTNVLNLRFHGLVTNWTQPIIFDNSLAASQVNNTSEISACNTNGTPAQLYSGPISGTGAFIRSAVIAGSGGVAILSGANTFTEGTTVIRGYLGIGADTVGTLGAIVTSPLGTGKLLLDDDTVGGIPGTGIFASGGPRTIQNEVVLNGTTGASNHLTAVIGTNALTFAGLFNVGGTVPKTFYVSNTALTTIACQVSNTASFTYAGPGTLALTADNTVYAGAMSVSGGKLLANNSTGSATGTNAVTVTGGTLAGTGIIAGAVTASGGGAVSPGNAVGTLTLQNGLNLSSGGVLTWNLGANSTNSSFSQLALTGGALTLGGSSVLNIQFTGTATAPSSTNVFWQSKKTWIITALSGGSTISGNFVTIQNGNYPAGTFSTAVVNGNIVLTYQPSVATFLALYDSGAGFISGENLILTNTSGTTTTVWSTTNTSLAVSNWTFVGVMSPVIVFGDGTSRYSITVTPTVSPTYYIAGNINQGPYLTSPVPVTKLTTSDFLNFTVAGLSAPISASGVLTLAVAPPVLTAAGASYSSSGGFTLRFTATVGQAYSVYASTNLSNWTKITNGTVLTSPMNITDPDAKTLSKRFYRISLP